MSVKTILVEDNIVIRDMLIPTMSELGDMEVVATAATADAAVTALREFDGVWQLAVVDLFLKEGNGLTVLRACSRRPRDRIVVVLTNYAEAGVREECLRLGADEVFDKSLQLDLFFGFCASRFH